MGRFGAVGWKGVEQGKMAEVRPHFQFSGSHSSHPHTQKRSRSKVTRLKI